MKNHEIRFKIQKEDYDLIKTFHEKHLSYIKLQEFYRLITIYGIKALLFEISHGLNILVGKKGISLERKN